MWENIDTAFACLLQSCPSLIKAFYVWETWLSCKVLSSVKSGIFSSLALLLFAHRYLFATARALVKVKQRAISPWIPENSHGTDISVVGGENAAPSLQAEQLICIGSSWSCPRFRFFPWFEWLGSKQGLRKLTKETPHCLTLPSCQQGLLPPEWVCGPELTLWKFVIGRGLRAAGKCSKSMFWNQKDKCCLCGGETVQMLLHPCLFT